MKLKYWKWSAVLLLLLANLFFIEKYIFFKRVNLQTQENLRFVTAEYYELYRQAESLREKVKRSDFMEFMEFAHKYRSPEFHTVLESTYRISNQYQLNPYLILSLIYHESGFNPRAISCKGAYGLMQINFAVWKEELKLDFYRIMEIEYNIDMGCRILKFYLKESQGNLSEALYLYNNGYMPNGNEDYPRMVLQGKFAAPFYSSAG